MPLSRQSAARDRDADSEMVSGINVTPLVDITLVLLIVFMVTARVVVTPSLPMNFPKESPGRQIRLVLGIELHANGDTLVDGRRVPGDESVFPSATKAYAEHDQLLAVIRADSAVQHGRVIRVLDLLSQAGITNIRFSGSAAAPESPRDLQAAPGEEKR